MTTDHELEEIRREVLDDFASKHGRIAAKQLLDELASDLREDLEGDELSSILETIQEEIDHLDLDSEPPEDPCDDDFMEEISS
jgi:predicted RecB family nuclease